ncbi:MAG: bifunctional enoyl-CoA hydratase/phosphate acetyltransferase [Bacteroidales bacterium]|nr:bifunctional enoyl-CoA hydratase/phosphate acetyltransferase [Bacteroidales bacterium]
MAIQSLNNIVDAALKKDSRKLAVAVAQDEDVLKAVCNAAEKQLITPILVGDKDEILAASAKAGVNISGFEMIQEPDNNLACAKAVKLVKQGQADILMKGLVPTGQLLRAILDKENGLLKGGLLSHLAFFESPYYHKILCITDAALNINPDFEEKVAIVRNAVNALHRIGIPIPLVAILAPLETVNPKMEATVHAAMLTQMQKRGQIEGCEIDGPLALDNAVSSEAARHKGLVSVVAGNADLLVAPDLNTGNVLYKALNFLGGAVCAAIVAGAGAPVVLTSRADQDKSKFLSIALAVSMT